MSDDLGPIEKIRKWVDHPYTSPETIVVQSDLATFAADDLARLLQERDEAAVRIRTLEAEVDALREARGVATGCIQKQLTHLQLWLSKNEVFLEESCVETFVYGDLLHAIRILAAIEPVPVTPAEAARVLLDATPNELERGINALHIAANSDHGADVCLAQALRALADAGEAGK